MQVIEKMERETGFEPATSSLGSWHSTTELLPPGNFSLMIAKGTTSAKWTVKWTVNQSGKPRLRRSRLLSTLLSIPRQIQHITLDVLPGITRSPDLAAASGVDPNRSWSPVCLCLPHLPGSIIPKNSVAISSAPHEITVPANPREPIYPAAAPFRPRRSLGSPGWAPL